MFFSADITRIRKQFANDWQGGRSPRIEDYLTVAPTLERSILLLELLCVEFAIRKQSDAPFETEEYLSRFPEDRETVAKAIELAKAPPAIESTFGAARSFGESTQDMPGPNNEAVIAPPSTSRYRKLDKLGEGAFGAVWLADDMALARKVAIKEPRVERLRNAADIEAYIAEAKILASLDHPHIVPVYDVGLTADGSCYVVSKLIDGRDLGACIKTEPLSFRAAAQLVMKVAEALQHTHNRGLVHRDIKPANILVDAQGRPYVADFGLALREEDFGKQNGIAGTPAYMSPEQARGEGHRIKAPSDIFSLGVVLYELLTGERPFHGQDWPAMRHQITNVEPQPPRERNEAIPKELERICLKALAKRAADRYLSAADLADDLRHWDDTPAVDSAPVAAKIVPKGLRSFEAADSEFFLDLLPGARDRDGLPETLRFWKTRVEETDPQKTFAVGLVYGPSGCGKSSLMKAGLLPRLGNHVLQVFLESTPDQTEQQLRQGLRRVCEDLPREATLVEMLAAIRRGQAIPAGRKVLLVLDQFEQWLYAHGAEQTTELAAALRQCDGERVQVVLLVRDDFWVPVSEFMRALEVRLVEGVNAGLVSLFDPPHAHKILAEFGKAYGRLPDNLAHLSAAQEAFLNQAVSGLAQDGKVICVRLALFADMMKGKAWTTAALKEVGGTAGIGTTFLEETFNGRSAVPSHRRLQESARTVLRSLLPVSGTNIKGHLRTAEELRKACGVAAASRDFAELIRILDSEIRLITPVTTEGQEPAYQLTHDYLVPSLRDWLTRKQRETRRGRAELLLEERAATWAAKEENRQLPSLGEYARIATLTKRRDWTEPQQRMIRRAGRHLATVWGAIIISTTLTIAGAGLFYNVQKREAEAQKREFERNEVRIAVDALQNSPAFAVAYAIKDLQRLNRSVALEELERRFGANPPPLSEEDAEAPKIRRLRLAQALASYGRVEVEYLISSIDVADGSECDNIATALRTAPRSRWQPELLRAMSTADAAGVASKDWTHKAKLAMVGLHAGAPAVAIDLHRLRDRPDPSQQTQFIHEFFDTGHGDLSRLLNEAQTWDDAGLIYGMSLSLGRVLKRDFQSSWSGWRDLLLRWYRNHPDSGVHSATGWALRKWGESLPDLSQLASRAPPDSRNWWPHELGFTMVRIPAGQFETTPELKGDAPRIKRLSEFWISDREVTIGLFQRFMRDNPHAISRDFLKTMAFTKSDRLSSEHPMPWATLEEAALFCNWLSLLEHRTPCYRINNLLSPTEIYKQAVGFTAAKLPVSFDPTASGYRLPEESEWEYACRAYTSTEFGFGNSLHWLPFYAATIKDSTGSSPVSRFCCNRFGLHDMHGNEWEWCHLLSTQDGMYPDRKYGKHRDLFSASIRGGSAGTTLNGLTSNAMISTLKIPSPKQYGFRVVIGFNRVAGDQSPYHGPYWTIPATRNTLTVDNDVPNPEGPQVSTQMPIYRVGAPPSIVIPPIGEPELKKIQNAWAAHLGSAVEKEITMPGGVKLAMVVIPPGEFERSEGDTESSLVRLTAPFFLGKYEVTQQQWQAVMGSNPSLHKTSSMAPVENVSWIDIDAFVTRMNGTVVGNQWRFALPTEAQWEFACRAGTTTEFSFGNDRRALPQYAWFGGNNPSRIPKIVGVLQPNAFGLHDMHGNVWEQCRDWFGEGYYKSAAIDDPIGPTNGTLKIGRGGWSTQTRNLGSAFRGKDPPDTKNALLGFRLALVTTTKQIKAQQPSMSGMPSFNP